MGALKQMEYNMTWTLFFGLAFAISGYASKEDCLAAARSTITWTTMCVPTPPGATVTGAGRVN